MIALYIKFRIITLTYKSGFPKVQRIIIHKSSNKKQYNKYLYALLKNKIKVLSLNKIFRKLNRALLITAMAKKRKIKKK